MSYEIFMGGEKDPNRRKLYFWYAINIIFITVFVFLLYAAYGIVFGGQPKEFVPSKDIKDLSRDLGKQEASSLDIRDINAVRRRLDGVLVPESGANLPPLAVMIDNHAAARPPSGLSRADLVVEAEVEGGITRFMAVYASGGEIEEIGPVRSVRPYFVDWTEGLGATLAHVGGSPAALAQLAKDRVQHINEFYAGQYFWRDEDKAAPHNVYTNSENMYAYLEKIGAEGDGYMSWVYKEDAAEGDRPEVGGLKVYFPRDTVTWKYDRPSNSYLRYIGGDAHADRSGVGITAKNVVAQYVLAAEIDSLLRLEMNHIGEGEALVCLDGACQEASWKKESPRGRTRFFDIDGNEVQFNAGATWVEVVRPGYEITFNT